MRMTDRRLRDGRRKRRVVAGRAVGSGWLVRGGREGVAEWSRAGGGEAIEHQAAGRVERDGPRRWREGGRWHCVARGRLGWRWEAERRMTMWRVGGRIGLRRRRRILIHDAGECDA